MRNLSQPNRSRQPQQAFTLIEILAVVGVIAILTGLLIMATGHMNRKAQFQRTRSFLCAIETALETYKSDNGTYPLTGLEHFSLTGGALNHGEVQKSNSGRLYRALSGAGGGSKYMRFLPSQLATDSSIGTYLIDGYGMPLNYYCINPPTNPLEAVAVVVGLDQTNLVAYGGQVRTQSFDLFSNGPDTYTHIPFTNSWTTVGGVLHPWRLNSARFPIMANDDIWCSD
ncbi:MAG: hypothetical protein PCFJNLEI_02099 [Verrucomicrobiae bacterium]|nr:hypothetical protein [Verrucomicrobiae bacterium]